MVAPTQQAALKRPYFHGELPRPGSFEFLAMQNTSESNARVYTRARASQSGPCSNFGLGLANNYWGRRHGNDDRCSVLRPCTEGALGASMRELYDDRVIAHSIGYQSATCRLSVSTWK